MRNPFLTVLLFIAFPIFGQNIDQADNFSAVVIPKNHQGLPNHLRAQGQDAISFDYNLADCGYVAIDRGDHIFVLEISVCPHPDLKKTLFVDTDFAGEILFSIFTPDGFLAKSGVLEDNLLDLEAIEPGWALIHFQSTDGSFRHSVRARI